MKSNQNNQFAIIYQSLYLANLLLLPVISFLVLVYYFHKAAPDTPQGNHLSRFNKIHLYRSIQISALAGVLLGVAPVFYIFYSAQFSTSVMVVVFYFVTLHTAFVLVGMLNLARAMAKKLPVF
ncbi:MAG: hypothetical protein OQK09_16605 [Colwellia sp.]|nr:hypothetical protein [Colwellia sp.]MCW8866567.1 hypothetical protein [Colwellia sp.]MCW9083129.1 hypothetical protein [Colwellia sp.]